MAIAAAAAAAGLYEQFMLRVCLNVNELLQIHFGRHKKSALRCFPVDTAHTLI